jgi:hypothetical protein
MVDAGDGNDASRAEFTTLAGEQSYLRALTFHAYPFHGGGGPTSSLVEHMMTPALLRPRHSGAQKTVPGAPEICST